jgi:hypothetical protein
MNVKVKRTTRNPKKTHLSQTIPTRTPTKSCLELLQVFKVSRPGINVIHLKSKAGRSWCEIVSLPKLLVLTEEPG